MKGKIPTIIVLVTLVIGVIVGVFLVRNKQIFRPGAQGEITPKDVRVTNITESSLTLSWTTDEETAGAVSFGKSESLGQTLLSEVEGQATLHSAILTGLTSDTNYFIKIISNEKEIDNNGVPWQAKTGPPLTPTQDTIFISGKILDKEGNPAGGILVYISIGGGTPLSTLTSSDGNWVVPISTARTPDLTSYITIDEQKSLAEISVQGGSLGVASAQIYPISAKPAPPITLGQVHDFRNLPPSIPGEIPGANIEIPETQTTSPDDITLESVKNGEVVATTQPEFFGEGPEGTVITVTLESEPIIDEVTVGGDGEWSWSPPDDLSPGTHKITLSWKDAQGILKTITRSFVVQAAAEPAFTATPSATPTSKATPTPTPKPKASTTPTPTPKALATPSATPTPTKKPTPTATGSALPDAGSSTQTLTLIIFAIALLTFSGLTSIVSFKKKAKSQ